MEIEIIPCNLSDHHRLRLVLNTNKNNRKPAYTWKLNNVLLNDNLVKEEIKKEIKGFLEFNENVGATYTNLWDTMKAVIKEKLTAMSASLNKETGESIHEQLDSTPESFRIKRNKYTLV